MAVLTRLVLVAVLVTSGSGDLCSPEALRTPLHGSKNCSSSTSGLQCQLSCDDGFVFYDFPDNVSLSFSCSAALPWSPPVIPACTATGVRNAEFQEVYRFLYTTPASVPDNCIANYEALAQNLLNNGLRNAVNDECHAAKFTPAVTGTVELLQNGIVVITADRRQMFVSYTIRHNDAPDASHRLCSTEFEKLRSSNYTLTARFVQPLSPTGCPSVTASGAGVRWVSGYSCPGTTKRINYEGVETCLSCPEGTHYTGNCTLCPRDTYRSDLSLSYCLFCPTGTSPAGSVSATQCQSGQWNEQ